VIGYNRGSDKTIWLTEWDCWQNITQEETNQIKNRFQCILHVFIFELRHDALMSKCSVIRSLNSNAKILDWPSSIVKDRALEAFMKIFRGLRNSRSVRESEGHVGVLCTTSARFCRCILAFKVTLHRGWGHTIG